MMHPKIRDTYRKGFFEILFIVLFLFPSALSAQEVQRGKLILTFTGIRSDKGQVALGLCDADRQWPENPRYPYKWEKTGLHDGKMTVVIDDIPYGTYAMAVLDDENRSLKMEFGLGLPREGWGMSTNPSFIKLVPPSFSECAFEIDAPVTRMEIRMNYIRKHKKVE